MASFLFSIDHFDATFWRISNGGKINGETKARMRVKYPSKVCNKAQLPWGADVTFASETWVRRYSWIWHRLPLEVQEEGIFHETR
jgi:hypothetical protein